MADFVEFQDKLVRKGTEQTPLNYWIQMNHVDMNLDLPFVYKLTHIHRKEMFTTTGNSMKTKHHIL